MQYIILVITIVSVTVVGDYFLKLSSLTGGFKNYQMFIGVVTYALTAFGWSYLMRFKTLDQIAVLYSAMTIVILSLMGWFVFNEPFTTKKMAAISLAIIAIFLVGE